MFPKAPSAQPFRGDAACPESGKDRLVEELPGDSEGYGSGIVATMALVLSLAPGFPHGMDRASQKEDGQMGEEFLGQRKFVLFRQELFHTQREFLKERTRCRALEEELENPMNIHRWRKLEVTPGRALLLPPNLATLLVFLPRVQKEAWFYVKLCTAT